VEALILGRQGMTSTQGFLITLSTMSKNHKTEVKVCVSDVGRRPTPVLIPRIVYVESR
jgi:hypothetical protein